MNTTGQPFIKGQVEQARNPDDWEHRVLHLVRSLKYGRVTIVVSNGKVVRIEYTNQYCLHGDKWQG